MAASFNKMQQPAYQHQPLGPTQIRLLSIETTHLQHVFPWISHGLKLFTTRHNLEDKPDFAAVSYVWGAAPASISIPCNGSSILITSTAYNMLEHLRLFGVPVWVDAICINQEDLEEKSTQIPLMQKIYTNASCVFVWIGTSNPSIQSFMLNFPGVMDLSKSWTRRVETDHPKWRGEDWPSSEHRFWEGAYYLLYDEWFKRVWTFQEILLPKRSILVVESIWIDGDDFFTFIQNGAYGLGGYFPFNSTVASRIQRNAVFPDFAFKTCSLIRWYRAQFRKSVPIIQTQQLANVLLDLQSRSVKEKVDRVWAVLGLLHERLQDQLKPLVDYSEQGRTEYWQTYTQFAKAVFVVEQSLALIDMPPCFGEDMGSPSWCPALSNQPGCVMLLDGSWNSPVEVRGSALQALLFEDNDDKKRSIARRYAITHHSQKYISITDDDRRLLVRGFVVDRISEVVEDQRLAGQLHYNEASDWQQWKMDNPIHAAAMSIFTRALSLARRTFYGSDDPLSPIPSQYLMCCLQDCRIMEDFGKTYQDAFTSLTTGGPAYALNLESPRRTYVMALLNRLIALIGHSFFATEGGRFGIATPGCKVGDKLCTFYSGESLYILRWPEVEGLSDAESSDEPAVSVSNAFIPYLMEQHERDSARLGADEIFTIK
jgi:hypothetical protein